MKARAIDQYIRRTTAGLPHLERIDTAAEIRVNLNQKIKELKLEGYPAEEAEYLAIRDMGDAYSTNRKLLGHGFTHQLGWIALALIALGGSSWWLWTNWYSVFGWDTEVRFTELTTQDIDTTLREDRRFTERGRYTKVEFQLPRGAKQLQTALVSFDRTNSGFLLGRTPDYIPLYPNGVQSPTRVALLIGNGISKRKTDDLLERHYLFISPVGINNAPPFSLTSSNQRVFNFLSSGAGIDWANLKNDTKAKTSSTFGTSIGWMYSHPTGKSYLRINEWYRVMTYLATKNNQSHTRTFGPLAINHVLIRASDQELNSEKPVVADIKLQSKQRNIDPRFINARGKPITVR